MSEKTKEAPQIIFSIYAAALYIYDDDSDEPLQEPINEYNGINIIKNEKGKITIQDLTLWKTYQVSEIALVEYARQQALKLTAKVGRGINYIYYIFVTDNTNTDLNLEEIHQALKSKPKQETISPKILQRKPNFWEIHAGNDLPLPPDYPEDSPESHQETRQRLKEQFDLLSK